MKLMDWFEKGMTFTHYVDSMTVHQEGLQRIYEHIQPSEEALKSFAQVAQDGWKVIVLTADWCGDAMLCVPIVKRLCEGGHIEMRLLVRDENLALMDQYLTNGTSRAIPIFIFIDAEGTEKAIWGPRSPEVQALVENFRAKLPAKDDPAFEEKQKEMYGQLRQQLTTDEQLWSSVVHSVTERIRPALA